MSKFRALVAWGWALMGEKTVRREHVCPLRSVRCAGPGLALGDSEFHAIEVRARAGSGLRGGGGADARSMTNVQFANPIIGKKNVMVKPVLRTYSNVQRT